MPLYEPTLPARYTWPLLQSLRGEQPAWLDDALAASGIDEALLGEPDATLKLAQFDILWEEMSRRTGRSDLGFQLGQRIRLDMHGPLSQAMARCATVDEMLRLSSRYSRLITPSFTMQYRRHPEHGELVWRPAAGMSAAALRAFEEIHVVSLFMQLRQMLGDRLAAYDSYLSMPPPPHLALYKDLRPLRAHFGSGTPLPEVRTVLDSRLLDLPLIVADGAPCGNRELDRLQGRFGKAQAWSAWVRLMLREAEHCQPTLAQLAELLNMSSHTLARKLAAEGCDYRLLSGEIRHQRACALLTEGQGGIADIAWRLGYTDMANFSHAFRKRSGMTPSAYRRECRAADKPHPV
ncbi:MAG: AraC family transcriptional regulator ligand-binding domain-containing protein [Pseudomonadota bacterium]